MTEPSAAVRLWSPSAERIERANITAYAAWLEREKGVATDGYDALWRWSVERLEEFWASIWEYYDVRSPTPHTAVLADASMPGAQWFPGARVNYAEHLFRGRDDAALAIQHASELRELGSWSWGELRTRTAAVAAGLRTAGVGEGDRVVAYMPNIPETIAAFLACASLGATWSSCSPDFGARTVVDRFAQIEPTVLLCVDGYRYGGKDFDRTTVIAGLQAELPTVRTTVVLPYLNDEPDLSGLRDAVLWDDFTGPADAELTFTPVAFDHPLWVLYSSGTTGLPKPIVQSQGGILLEQLKKLNLHLDAHADDRVLWFTTTGWMMWNFLVGVLLTPASIVLYDGNPGHPDLGVLWDLAERAGVTTFGTGAAFIASCIKAGTEPADGRDLSRLTAIGATGSPLSPEGFRWVYEHVGADTWLFSTSGGTDVCTAFVGGVPTEPVYLGELQSRSLGCDVQAWDEDGSELPAGAVGELVLTQPMPSMPVFFWGDEDGSRYHDSYFAMYPGIWRHGDWIEFSDRGTAVIHGRSDSTINRGGIRMGTAEIYAAVLAIDEILDALIVDVPKAGTEGVMPLFVVLREGTELDDDLVRRIARRVREDCSPRHVPDVVEVVAQIPRTLSGKVLEVPVKRILMGQPADKAASRDSLADPSSLDWFVDYAARPDSGG
ncbi:Acetyl-coenzyme A synthetase [Paraconexibacter sp. AEG42_29]|uniref:Acetyl-coenzyme A synthetase n=1 Tax=Paraconexibacter sp. AEG42_29 TaxID=2997339 RepID=A0AAU7ATN3_9ACTN